MPTYKVPTERDYSLSAVEGKSKRKEKTRQPTTHGIPMDPKVIGTLSVGEDIEVTLKGKLVGLSMSDDNEYGKDSTIRIAVDSVEHYDYNEVEEVLNAGEED